VKKEKINTTVVATEERMAVDGLYSVRGVASNENGTHGFLFTIILGESLHCDANSFRVASSA
jgi:hypothetical protein